MKFAQGPAAQGAHLRKVTFNFLEDPQTVPMLKMLMSTEATSKHVSNGTLTGLKLQVPKCAVPYTMFGVGEPYCTSVVCMAMSMMVVSTCSSGKVLIYRCCSTLLAVVEKSNVSCIQYILCTVYSEVMNNLYIIFYD